MRAQFAIADVLDGGIVYYRSKTLELRHRFQYISPAHTTCLVVRKTLILMPFFESRGEGLRIPPFLSAIAYWHRRPAATLGDVGQRYRGVERCKGLRGQ